MARLDARWDNFWQRGQIWYGFDQDGPSGSPEVASSFSADAVLQASVVGAFASDAVVLVPATGSFSGNAVVRQTASSHVQADAVIRRTASASLTTDAILRREQSGSFTADAQTTDEVAEFVVLYDEFDRVTASGLGAAYPDWSEWWDGEPTTFMVDGETVVEDPLENFTYGAWFGTPRAISAGTIRFDLKVPANESECSVAIWTDSVHFALSFYSPEPPWIYIGHEESQLFVDVEPFPDEWYSFLIEYDDEGNYGCKLWNREDAEPGSFSISGNIDWNLYEHDVVGLELALYGNDFAFDNLLFTSVEPTWIGGAQFQASAEIYDGELRFFADAEIVEAPPTVEVVRDLFSAFAFIAQEYRTNLWTAEGIIHRERTPSFSANACLAGQLLASAWILDLSGTIYAAYEADAVVSAPLLLAFTAQSFVVLTYTQGFTAKSEISPATVMRAGQITTDAWVIGTVASFTADAQTAAPATNGATATLDAVISDTYYVIAFTADAVSLDTPVDAFICQALIFAGSQEGSSFTADADIAFSFTAAAVLLVSRSTDFTVFLVPVWANAVIYRPWHPVNQASFTADAVVANGSIALDAVISGEQIKEIETAALITGAIPGSFAASATIGSGWTFKADAYVQPYWTADAYIRSKADVLFNVDGDPLWGYDETGDPIYVDENGYPTDIDGNRILDGDGNPVFIGPNGDPVDEDGDPILDGGGSAIEWQTTDRGRAQEIQIIIRKDNVNTDITEHVVWSETSFTQNAKTTAGTFSCVLRGSFTQWDGGEDIYVNVDGRRQFGGLVLNVSYGSWFSDKTEPRTVVSGADYNIYFDRLILWNKANKSATGEYRPPNAFPKNYADRHLIREVCRTLLDRPPGFDYETNVDQLEPDLNTEEKWMVNTGQSFRSFMGEVSKITNAIWWIDQYLDLHYHERGVVTAPWPITDGIGGASCQNLTYTKDSSQMLNDIFVYGTLASTTEGEIYLARRQNETTIERHGLRQHCEVRSDLHLERHVNRRANSIRSRRSIPIRTASLDLFTPGFSVGQVAELNIGTYGLGDELVIRELTLTFATIQGPIDGKYYGNARYHLELGLQPDDPWNIYDMLPWDLPDWKAYPNWETDIGEIYWGEADNWQVVDDFSDVRCDEDNFQRATNNRTNPEGGPEERWWDDEGTET